MPKLFSLVFRVVVISAFVFLSLNLPTNINSVIADEVSRVEFSKNQLLFIENVGQYPEYVRYQVFGGNNAMWLANDGIWIAVSAQEELVSKTQRNHADSNTELSLSQSNQSGMISYIKLTFEGANSEPIIEPVSRVGTTVN